MPKYSFPAVSNACTTFVAFDNAITSTPVTPGSSVPEWPAFLIPIISCT